MFLISKGFHLALKASSPFLITWNTSTKHYTLSGTSSAELGMEQMQPTAQFAIPNAKNGTKILCQRCRFWYLNNHTFQNIKAVQLVEQQKYSGQKIKLIPLKIILNSAKCFIILDVS